jgi:shikimate kinase
MAVVGMVFASAVGKRAAAAETGFELAAGMGILGKGPVMEYLTSRVPAMGGKLK